MKKIKMILPMLALCVAVASAFAFHVPKAKAVSLTLFYFQGGPLDDVNNAALYNTSPLQNVECGGDGIVCSIMAEPSAGDATKPQFVTGHTVSGDPEYYSTSQRQ